MSRLTLKSGISLADLGERIFAASASNKSMDPTSISDAEGAIADCFNLNSNDQLHFVYDGQAEFHIVIPALEDAADFDPGEELDRFAAEAMGYVSIMGCHN